MALSAALFAAMYFFAHLASASRNVPWTFVAGVRACVGALVAIGLAKMRGVSFVAKSTPRMWMRSLFGTTAMLCTFYATGSPNLALGDGITLVNLAPVMLAFLAPLMLGERAGRRVLVAIPLSLAGVICIVRPALLFGHEAADAKMIFPALVAIAGSFFGSLAMVMLRQVSDRESPEAIATHFSLTAAVAMGVLSLPLAGRVPIPGATDLAIMVTAGLCAGFAQIAMTRAYALELAARVSPFSYLQVVIGALLGAFALSQWPDGLAIVGMLLVIGGGVFVSIVGLREQRRRA